MQAEQSIVVDPKRPGGINSPHGLILFDGVCILCSRGCRFVSKRDRRGYFRFVPIQVAEERPLAEQLGIDPDRGRWLFGGINPVKKTWSMGCCGLESGDAVKRSRLGN
jgi:DCC1-like thiol-disulfide oxidoreductase